MLKTSNGVPPWLSGFICAFHPATPGSSTKHTIYAFINLYSTIYNLYFTFGKDENKKRGRDWPIFFKKTQNFKWKFFLYDRGLDDVRDSLSPMFI